jgi:hypothetical protein
MTAPAVMKAPVVMMSIASAIGPRNDLVVDLSSSTGSGGRAWESLSFVVFGSNVSLLQDYLSSMTLEPSPSLVRLHFLIPHQLLNSGYGYSLNVRSRNFLVKSEKLCFGSASGGFGFPEPNNSLQELSSFNLWRWLYFRLWCEESIVLDLQLVIVPE